MFVVRAHVTLIQIKGGSLKKWERKEYVFGSASFGLKCKFNINFGCGVFKNHQIATFRDIEIYVSGRSLTTFQGKVGRWYCKCQRYEHNQGGEYQERFWQSVSA